MSPYSDFDPQLLTHLLTLLIIFIKYTRIYWKGFFGHVFTLSELNNRSTCEWDHFEFRAFHYLIVKEIGK